MEIKVREVTDVEEKSSQQIEQELLDKHEQKQEAVEQNTESVADDTNQVEDVQEKEEVQEEIKEEAETPLVEEQPPVEKELAEEEVLSYIGKRYGKEISSIDELVSTREESEPLPEDVAAYLKYKKETGRGFNDFAKLQKDYSDLSPDALLREYYTITEEGLDSDDITSLLEEFDYTEETHEPSEIKKLKLAKKKEIAKAKKFLREQQDLYKQPLESRESSAAVDNEEIIQYRQYMETAKATYAENEKKSQWFEKKTNEVLNPEFKGFKFNIGETDYVYSPGSVSDIKKAHQTPMNLLNKFMDTEGYIKDAEGYHKALAVAMNPEGFAKFFYEQGKSQATDDVMRKTKNIEMSERQAPQVATKSGFQVKSVSQPSSRGLRIKSIKKS
tara:strand:+ start:819 stop:1979 length:1161 start_codon:yes stop_codon:yes gene_type:complete